MGFNYTYLTASGEESIKKTSLQLNEDLTLRDLISFNVNGKIEKNIVVENPISNPSLVSAFKELYGANEDTTDIFGSAVAVNDAGDIIVVGAPYDDGTGNAISSAGTVYVFYKDEGGTDNWGLKKSLFGGNEDASDFFGYSVAIDGTTIVVGAYQDDGTGNAISAAGTVYVFYKDEGGTDNWGLKKTLVNGPNEDASDYFGRSVAIDGTTIVVGAYQDDGTGNAISAAGTAYVFYKDEGGTDNWGLKASLFGANEDASDYFGYSVAIDGTTIVVGAYNDGGSTNTISSAGSAYVYYKDEGGTDNWGLKKSLFGANEDSADYFGSAVAISGSTIVVGAYNDDGTGDLTSGAGTAYVFYKDEGGTDNWGLKKTLYGANEDTNDNFGRSVAIDGTTIVVGANQDDGVGDLTGGAGTTYVFDKNEGGTDNWGLKKSLFGANEDANDWFGYSVAISGTTIVVGASQDDGTGDAISQAGTAYVFDKNSIYKKTNLYQYNHEEIPTLKDFYAPSANEDTSDAFGNSVAIDGTTIVVGAFFDDGVGDTIGAAGTTYVYYKDEGGTDNWGLKKTLYADPANDDSFDYFGYSVAIDGTTIVVGAKDDDGTGDAIGSAGSTYVYYKDEGGTDNWGLKKNLYGANEDVSDNFGGSVAIDGTTIVVGAEGDDGTGDAISAAGTTYVYYKDEGGTDNWGLKKTLYGANEDSSDRFGGSVAISGSTIVVGAYNDDGTGNAISGAGSAYVYYKDEGGTDNWGLKASLFGPNEDTNDWFGKSVAINETEDIIVVSAYVDDGSTNAILGAGSAYVYYKDEGGTDNWGLKASLFGPNEDADDWFGRSVAISGSTIVVGASQDDGTGDAISAAGTIYVFDKNEGGTDNWGLVNTLTAPLNVEDTGDGFGFSVAIDGTNTLVGAYSGDGSTNAISGAGGVYLFDSNSSITLIIDELGGTPIVIGIMDENGLTDETKEIILKHNIASGFTGLNIGSYYCVDINNPTVLIDESTYTVQNYRELTRIGIAISATEILLT